MNACPSCEWHIRAVPRSESYNGSSRYVACAGPHHGEPFGPLVLIDTSIEDDGLMSQVKRITPGKFPESEINSKQSWNYGAPLMKYLDKSHYKVELSKEERRRITLWLDCNSNEIGAYHNEKLQREGKIVWPTLDCNPKNILGVETR